MPDRSTLAAAAGLVALAIAMGVGRFAFTPLLPMMQADADLSVVQGGWLASANYMGYLLGGLSAVALRIAPARVIHLGLALVGLSTLAMGFTSNVAAWIGLRGIAGVASAWVLVFASSSCLDSFQQAAAARRPVLSATLFAGVGVGIAFAGSLCAILLMAHATSAFAWTTLGIAALAATAFIWGRFSGSGAATSTVPTATPWNPATVRLILCYGAFGFGYIIPATFLAAMAREAAAGSALYGWSWPLFGAAAAASTFLAAALRGKIDDRWQWIAGHGLMALGVVLPLAWPGLAGIVVSALLVGGTFMVVTMVGIQEARRAAGPAAKPLIAAMTSAFAVGQIAGPLLVSFLAARGHGFDLSLAIVAAVLLAAAAALIPYRSRSSP